ncbi:MAG: GNAT family N-acetyltransferase, partial [Clostridiales bacterium]|nr:GNAT family N-acetyltransferase [Clostridiales bacterium]
MEIGEQKDYSESNDLIIRNVMKDDVEDLLNIYSYYVANTAITFEYEVPSIEEFSIRV